MAATSPGAAALPRVVLDAAIGGDEAAFRRLVEPHHSSLHAHCYRMLGSIHDAEDALQEVLLRTWRSLHRFEPDRPLRPWLYAIATNACLDAIARRSKHPLHRAPDPAATTTGRASGAGPWVPPPVWLEPYPDVHVGVDGVDDGAAGPEARYEQREAVELAFVVALHHLPARQRAVLILRDVLELSAHEVARALAPPSPPSTAPCSAPGGPCPARCPGRASRRRCAHSDPSRSGCSSSGSSTPARRATSRRSSPSWPRT